MGISITPTPFGTLSVALAEVEGTLSASVLATAPCSLDVGIGIIPPMGQAYWGEITGDLADQTDLYSALAGKYDASNPAGYITSSALSGYATESWVTSQGYITSSALTPYALISSLGTAAYENTSYWIQSPSVAAADGQIPAWDAATSRSVWIDNNARSLFLTAKNVTGSTIPKGAAVYVSGGQGGNPEISLAKADAESTSSKTIGITTEAIGNTLTGTVIVGGAALKLDTSAYTEGQALYLSPTTAGGFVTSLPTQPYHGVLIGYVTRSHATVGVIEVAIQNYQELQELSDVLITSKANGDLISWDSSAGVWKNKSLSTMGIETTSHAAATYQTISGMSDYLSKAGNLSGLASVSTARTNLGLGTMATASASDYSTTTVANGLYYPLSSNPSGYLVSSDLSGYLTSSTAAATYQTISGMSSYLTTSSAASTYLTQTNAASTYLTQANAASTYASLAGATFTGTVTVASSSARAGLNLPFGSDPTLQEPGDIWLNSSTDRLTYSSLLGSSRTIPVIEATNVFTGSNVFQGTSLVFGNSTANTTISVGNGATVSGSTKNLNLGTNGVSGSTTNINIGSSTGTSTTGVSGTFTAFGNVNLGNSTGTLTVNVGNGATVSGSTKTVNVGTAGVSGSTTNITIGATAGTSTTTLNGTVNATTAAADTNTTQIATTAFVVGQASSSSPVMDGTATVGTSLKYARADHIHPSDTTKANLNSPTFTGTPSLPTGTTAVTQAAGTNNTSVATTAFVAGAVPAFATNAQARAATSTTLAVSPMSNRWALNSQNIVKMARGNFTSTVTGTVSLYNSQITTWSRLGTAGACSIKNRNYGNTQTDQSYFFETKANPGNTHNFSKPRLISGRTYFNSYPDLSAASMVTWAFYHGKAEGDALGDLTRKGLGWKYTGGTAPQYLVFLVHNGTTLTPITTTYSPTALIGFDWDIESDGAGNAVMYVNGSVVATATGTAPTGTSFLTPTVWQEEFVATSAPPGNCDFVNSRSTITIID